MLRKAHTAIEAAKAARVEGLDPALPAEFRARYDKAVTWGQVTIGTGTGPKATIPATPSPVG